MQLFHTQTSQTQWRVANARTARSPQCLHSGGSRGKAMGPFHTALEKNKKNRREKCSHWLRVVIATGLATFFLFPNKTTRQGAADQPFFVFICPRVVLPATTTAWYTKIISLWKRRLYMRHLFFHFIHSQRKVKRINASPTQHTRTQNTHFKEKVFSNTKKRLRTSSRFSKAT